MNRVLVIVAVAVALLAGCSGGSRAKPDTPFPTESANAAATSQATVEAPSPTVAPVPSIVPSSDKPNPYGPGVQFQVTDLLDLARIPPVGTRDWPRVTTPDGGLSVRYPPGWGATGDSGGSGVVRISKPLLPGQVLAECRRFPGYVHADLTLQRFPVTVDVSGEHIVRDLVVRLPSNGMNARVLQAGGAGDLCGPDFGGELLLVPQPPFPGEMFLNGPVVVQFPATAGDIAIAFAILESVFVR